MPKRQWYLHRVPAGWVEWVWHMPLDLGPAAHTSVGLNIPAQEPLRHHNTQSLLSACGVFYRSLRGPACMQLRHRCSAVVGPEGTIMSRSK